MKRRQFVGGLAAAAGISACAGGEPDCADASTEVFNWSMVTSWPPGFPGLGAAADNLAKRLGEASGGRLNIKVYAGGELVPAFEVFDAVSRGTVEMGHDASYYHRGKLDAAQFFTSIPFGFNMHEMNGWLYYGDGLTLWRELYEPFDLVPFPTGNTGVQMGGWFNREINSLDDLKGLKMRIPGLGGEVLRRAGGTPVNLPGSEIFTSLSTGAIDATEWVGPYNDLSFGLHKAARYYYYPGWQEPSPALETIINKAAWDSLPDDLKALVELACQAITTDMAAEYAYGNTMSLKQLEQMDGVELRRFPDDVLERLRAIAEEIYEEMAASDPKIRKIYDSYRAFQVAGEDYQRISEQAFLETR